MRIVHYLRQDVARLVVRPDETGALTRVQLIVGARLNEIACPRGGLPAPDAARAQHWRQLVVANRVLLDTYNPRSEDEAVVRRLTVEVRDRRATALPWEDWLTSEVDAEEPVVRICRVPPRAAARPLTFPIRVLEVDPSPPDKVTHVFGSIFGPRPHDAAFVVDECAAGDVLPFRERSGWPTAEILHYEASATLSFHVTGREVDRLAGELHRLTSSWQTRLVVFEHGRPVLDGVREVAAALADRGGPAVMLMEPWPGDQRRTLYAELVHDQPLDVIVGRLSEKAYAELIAGSGREELLRVTAIVAGLTAEGIARDLERALKTRGIATVTDVAAPGEMEAPAEAGGDEGGDYGGGGWSGSARRGGTFSRPEQEVPYIAELRQLLADLPDHLEKATFDQETRGTLPSSERVRAIQEVWWEINDEAPEPVLPEPPEVRAVNARLMGESGEMAGRLLDPRTARLSPQRAVHLAIQIGRPDERLVTVGATAFLEEAVLWKPEETETELEIGVTPLDFELLGAHVQEIRLPRRGESETATFTLVPRERTRVPGVARLRFCLYHRNNLLQSFRLVAALQEDPPRPSLRASFACALDIKTTALKEVSDTGGYLTRCEYSALDLAAAATSPPRALSFFANDSAGQAAVTLKGTDLFEATTDGNVPDALRRAREMLETISSKPGILAPFVYRFATGVDDAGWNEALGSMAEAGWELYTLLVPEDARSAVETMLDERAVIHAGHLNLEHVLPWGLVYTRFYDGAKSTCQPDPTAPALPVLRAACPASLPAPNGHVPAGPCGGAGCLLEPAHVAAQIARGGPVSVPETTACARHFWGFRHVIEVPVQQVAGGARQGAQMVSAMKMPPAMQTKTKHCGPVRLDVGYNAGLSLAADHNRDLATKLCASGVLPLVLPLTPLSVRDDILRRLERNDSDVVYFFCHAQESFIDPTTGKKRGPHLQFHEPPGWPGTLAPQDLGRVKFSNAPLVFLNGCGTVGFTTAAPSAFIRSLVQNCRAAAVIGTETTIWEGLATEMAIAFLARFLTGQAAGDALLQARLHLLSTRNPLGLVYTLYGAADLVLSA